MLDEKQGSLSTAVSSDQTELPVGIDLEADIGTKSIKNYERISYENLSCKTPGRLFPGDFL